MLSTSQRQRLLALARASVTAACSGEEPPLAPRDDPALLEPRACFVTLLRADGSLRGCIGRLDAGPALAEAVIAMAATAATRDPRFRPVEPNEVPDLQLDVSALTPSERISPTEPGAIEVGRHGLVVTRGERRGVLLPQVASERGWDVSTFLEQTCVKASLPESAYLDPDTVVERFEAEVFGERDPPIDKR